MGATFVASTIVAIVTSLYWLLVIPFGLLLFYAGWQHRQIFFYLLIKNPSVTFIICLAIRATCNNELPDLFTFFYTVFNSVPEMDPSVQS